MNIPKLWSIVQNNQNSRSITYQTDSHSTVPTTSVQNTSMNQNEWSVLVRSLMPDIATFRGHSHVDTWELNLSHYLSLNKYGIHHWTRAVRTVQTPYLHLRFQQLAQVNKFHWSGNRRNLFCIRQPGQSKLFPKFPQYSDPHSQRTHSYSSLVRLSHRSLLQHHKGLIASWKLGYYNLSDKSCCIFRFRPCWWIAYAHSCAHTSPQA